MSGSIEVGGIEIGAGANLDPQDIALSSGKIIIGNGSNVGQARDITGDITITNAGVASLSNRFSKTFLLMGA